MHLLVVARDIDSPSYLLPRHVERVGDLVLGGKVTGDRGKWMLSQKGKAQMGDSELDLVVPAVVDLDHLA